MLLAVCRAQRRRVFLMMCGIGVVIAAASVWATPAAPDAAVRGRRIASFSLDGLGYEEKVEKIQKAAAKGHLNGGGLPPAQASDSLEKARAAAGAPEAVIWLSEPTVSELEQLATWWIEQTENPDSVDFSLYLQNPGTLPVNGIVFELLGKGCQSAEKDGAIYYPFVLGGMAHGLPAHEDVLFEGQQKIPPTHPLVTVEDVRVCGTIVAAWRNTGTTHGS